MEPWEAGIWGMCREQMEVLRHRTGKKFLEREWMAGHLV